ncbi:MAG: ferredoxin--nitrite reductase [Clostridia bacterium]|nr:ferredoxin--nitrite reductase [Clostridia bacterium]
MLKIPEQVIQDGKNFRGKIEELNKGILEPERFKPQRVSMGIYEQRDRGTYMTRTRIPSGVVTLKQLEKVSELAKVYGHGFVHLTTRQDIQFHKVTLEDTANLIEGLLEVGIVTRGTGGNTARNVACSPLAGVARDEVFDVTPFGLVTTEYILKDPTSLNLPRKFKIAFSNSPEDTGNATIADLGFVAKFQNGEIGFEVYGGGGFGAGSRVSLKLEDFIPATEVLYHVQAMKELFENEGDRRNKNKARLRFVVYRLGEEAFKVKYQELVQKVKSEKSLNLFFKIEKPSNQIGEAATTLHPLLYQQRQEGKYSVYVHPENGNLSVEDLDQVIEFIAGLGYEPSIRLTTMQGLYVRDLDLSDAEKLLDLITKFTSKFNIDNSVACAGAATCQLGLGLSQNLLTAIIKRFSEASEDIKGQLPRIFISGCPNSCGQHYKGAIGFYGRVKRVNDGLVPMYSILFGGTVGVGKAVLGTEYGAIPAKKIPEFLYQLAQLKRKANITDFVKFINQETATINNLIESFATIEPKAEALELYSDFGTEEEFSLRGRGPGECSAGVLDVIQLDISNAQSSLNDFEKTKESKKLYNASISAARALLILKGIDTINDRLIFQEFVKHFVDTGYVKQNIKNLFEQLLNFKLGGLDSLENHIADVKYLVAKVIQMYESLDTKLGITLTKEHQGEETAASVKSNAESALNTVDLKGVKCPINFV